MEKFQGYQEYLVSKSVQIPITSFCLNLLLVAALTFLLGRIYIRYGNSLSNRAVFSKNFLLIAMTTMFIIAIVKSSLALSLGLVGALSIVRFRAAIKEPEELGYLFLAIAVGLGLGADQSIITVVAFFIIITILVIRKKFSRESDNKHNLHLTIHGQSDKIKLLEIVKLLDEHFVEINLKRFDSSKDLLECSFLVEINNIIDLNNAEQNLRKMDDSVKVSFLDNKGII